MSQMPQTDDGRDARWLSELLGRLSSEFPTADPELIRGAIEASLDRTSAARVQHYRLVLAEREVRRLLRNGSVPPSGSE